LSHTMYSWLLLNPTRIYEEPDEMGTFEGWKDKSFIYRFLVNGGSYALIFLNLW
jgi:hypothetical protein